MSDYDVAIIGTGAGGGTLAYALAGTGKRILILERGGFLPREKENWDPLAVVHPDARLGRGVEVGPYCLTIGFLW